jgi:tRNA threonylcarbamoyladenosine biosynthesis protein TsaB
MAPGGHNDRLLIAMLLALDTSTHMASIALATGHEVLGEYSWQVGQNHGTALFSSIQWILAASNRTMADVSVIAVAIGPGSFNGIRVAVTAAKALAFGLSVPLIGICGLDVLAYAHLAADRPIFAVQEAGRGELYAAGYYRTTAAELAAMEHPPRETWLLLPDDSSRVWARSTDYMLTTPAELATMAGEHTLFCGEMHETTRALIHQLLGHRAVLLPTAVNMRRASVLATLAEQRLRRGQTDDPLTLEPLYLRRPAITASKKQPLPGSEPTGQRQQTDEMRQATPRLRSNA